MRLRYIILAIITLMTITFVSIPKLANPQGSTGNTGQLVWDATKEGWVKLTIESNGALPVNLQDQTTDIIDLYLHRHTGESATISSNTAIQDKVINVVSGYIANPGELVCMKEGVNYYQGAVLSNTITTITLDTPLDFAFTTAAELFFTDHDLSVDGSGTTQIFHIQPTVEVEWDIVRIMFYIEDSTVMDDGKFGGMGALLNGVVLRKKDTVYHNIFNVKTNGDFAQRAYDRTYISKPPSGTGHSMIVRRTFGGQSKNGVVIRLDGDIPDELEVLVQDDLTPLDHFHVVVQGHIVTD